MEPRTYGTYGAPFQDQEPVEDPTTQIDSGQFNRLCEDLAQATRTVVRGWVSFLTDAGAGVPISVNVEDGAVVWGSGSGKYPTITKTVNPGVYTIEYDTDYTDDLGAVETVDIRFAAGQLNGSTFGLVQCDITAVNTITVRVADTSGTLSDHGGGDLITVWFR